MFSADKADFRHLSAQPLFISKALQKAKIVVSEDGTKAAAATAAILQARSSPPWVTVDRPFLFLIRHKSTDTMGVYIFSNISSMTPHCLELLCPASSTEVYRSTGSEFAVRLAAVVTVILTAAPGVS
ncbi:hypothetical protein INR49_032696 [Caranx melampygus]|nr:hypothetical protein INR49_032696 [Caranx melampygus]